jgi:hypothetical protein
MSDTGAGKKNPGPSGCVSWSLGLCCSLSQRPLRVFSLSRASSKAPGNGNAAHGYFWNEF